MLSSQQSMEGIHHNPTDDDGFMIVRRSALHHAHHSADVDGGNALSGTPPPHHAPPMEGIGSGGRTSSESEGLLLGRNGSSGGNVPRYNTGDDSLDQQQQQRHHGSSATVAARSGGVPDEIDFFADSTDDDVVGVGMLPPHHAATRATAAPISIGGRSASDIDDGASGLPTAPPPPVIGANTNGLLLSASRAPAAVVYVPRHDDAGRNSHTASLWAPVGASDTKAFNRRRFTQLTVGIFMAVMVGIHYAFGLMSAEIKKKAGFRQSDMTTITTVGNCLFAFTFPAGVLFDYYGPKPVLLVSVLFGIIGFVLLACIFADVLDPSLAVVSIANGLTNWQSGFIETATLLGSLFVFPTNKGEVVIIQKTFFALGSTFFSLSFSGFFAPSDNFIGYCAYVGAVATAVTVLGAHFTAFPAYKRTGAIAAKVPKMSEGELKALVAEEEHSFELYHNPRISDRRRLNYGVTVLLITLTFFASLSIIKAFVQIDTGVTIFLTLLAVACIVAFAGMLYPRPMPAFFDYAFLPDLHPPEEYVCSDKVNAGNGTAPHHHHHSSRRHAAVDVGLSTRELTERPVAAAAAPAAAAAAAAPAAAVAAVASQPAASASVSADRATLEPLLPEEEDEIAFSSVFRPRLNTPSRASVTVMPSVTVPFSTSIRHPFIWCFWISAFAIQASNFIFFNNVTQIYVALNDGKYDKTRNALYVALIGLGSAIGRICSGFGETLIHRRNTVRLDRQLELLAKKEAGTLTAAESRDLDVTPVYHHWGASIASILPFPPMMVCLMCLLLLVIPAEAIGVVFVVASVFIGMFLTVFPLSIKEIFSVDVAKHLNFVFSSGIVATVLLNRLMFGMWYDEEYDRQQAAKHAHDNSNSTTDVANMTTILTKRPTGDDDYYYTTLATITPTPTTAPFTAPLSSGSAATNSHKFYALDATIASNNDEGGGGGGGEGAPIDTVFFSDASSAAAHRRSFKVASGGGDASSAECIGVMCIRDSFLVLAGINALAVLSGGYASYHWWQVRRGFNKGMNPLAAVFPSVPLTVAR